MRRHAFAATALAAAATATTTLVSVDWASTLRPLRTVVAHQTVVNPLTTRESPIHDAVYASIAHLGNDYQRWVARRAAKRHVTQRVTKTFGAAAWHS